MALDTNDMIVNTTLTKQGMIVPKCGTSASDPTVNEDSSTGYDIGDLYYGQTSANHFICSDNSVGAAVWEQIALSDLEVKTKYENNSDTNAFSDSHKDKVDHLTVTQAVNLDTIESNTATNNAKVSFPEAPNDGEEYVRKNLAWAIATGGGNPPSDMPGLQMKRTTDRALTATETNITFNLTPFENDSSIIEHNNTNTDRMEIKETGAYLLGINLSCLNDTPQDNNIILRLRINDTNTAASLIFQIEKNTTDTFSRTIPVTLNSGDYLTVDAKTSNTELILKADSVFWAIRLTGATGATGAPGVPGSDGDLTWEGNYSVGPYTANQAIKYTDGNSYVCHTNTTADQLPTDTNYWDILAEKGETGAGGGGAMCWAFASQNKNGVDTTSTVYTVMATLTFPGASVMTPSAIQAAVNSAGTGNNQHIKIFDKTNSLTIAEKSWAESTTDKIESMGALSNLSTGPAIWEMQMKISGGTNTFKVYSLTSY